VEKIVELKKQYPNAKVLAHPECKKTLLILADKVGSTAALLDYAVNSDNDEFIVATESGIIHQMKKSCPGKTFIAAPPNDSTCGCNDCSYMKLNTLEKVYNALKFEAPEIQVDAAIIDRARRPIDRMLELS
jgi:quinolinate synthase